MKKPQSYSIFFALFSAFLLAGVGRLYPDSFPTYIFVQLDWLGSLFLRALTALVMPLVLSSIIASMAKLGADSSFRRLGGKTALCYFGTTLVALFLGLVFVNIIQPGKAYDLDLMRTTQENLTEIKTPFSQMSDWVFMLIPKNIFQAMVDGQMVPLIIFSLLLGIAITKVDKKNQEHLIGFFEGIFQAMVELSSMVLSFLPFGIFCLTAHAFFQLGETSIKPLILFMCTVSLGLASFMFVVMPILLYIYAKVDPWKYMKAMSPALFTACMTSSSSASIPITMDCVEKNVGVSSKVTRLIVPLGISINLSGSALYECVAAIFVAQAYGIDLSLPMQFGVLFLALIASMGVAGIPAGSLVATMIILQAMGLPPEGIGLFIAAERFMDMARTTVNIYGDGACAVLVAKSEGEKGFCMEETAPSTLNAKDIHERSV
mgnify:CR=1 FL=1